MTKHALIPAMTAALLLAACSDGAPTPAASDAGTEAAAMNTLTAREQAEGWRLLFNGRDFSGWRVYRGAAPAEPWRIEDGALMLAGGGGGDIVTEEEFGPFELALDWKVSPGGNSGIMYLVHEADEIDYPWRTGPEYQVLDDAVHADGQIPSHRAGALYDFAEPLEYAANPVGEWNQARIVFTGARIEHWLNGRLVAQSSYGDDAWRAAVAGSKFRDMPLFGTFDRGRIALQDHGDPVWYRNIRIRPYQS